MKQLTGYMHGVNLGGWLSQCGDTKEHYDTFITKDDLKTIRSWGADHVRVPVDYVLVETEEGVYRDEGFGYIQKAIDWCRELGLNMILDLHKTSGFSFDRKDNGFFETPALHERFCRLWEQFARRFGEHEDMLCFELLNEVTDKAYGSLWNEIAATCIVRIRAQAPTIRIIVGSYWNNSAASVKDLDPPYDEHIIYTFHCYEPLLFTHQGAPWLGEQMDPDFRWPLDATFAQYAEVSEEKIGSNFSIDLHGFRPEDSPDEKYFEALFEEAVQIAASRNTALYCGEFGVIDRAAPEEILKWYRLICSVLDRHNIGRAAWSYKAMDFGIADSFMDGIRPDLLKLL